MGVGPPLRPRPMDSIAPSFPVQDIQKLKRIAAMTAELRKHHIASDSEDALRQSEAIFQERSPKRLMVNSDLSVSSVGEEKPAETPHSVAGISMPELERFQNTVNTRLNVVEENVSSVIGKMNEMIKIITKLEQRLEQGGVPELPKERQETIAKKEDKKETTGQLRSGDYKPGDVEIDRIFYFGKK